MTDISPEYVRKIEAANEQLEKSLNEASKEILALKSFIKELQTKTGYRSSFEFDHDFVYAPYVPYGKISNDQE